jgi:hypothetical protein
VFAVKLTDAEVVNDDEVHGSVVGGVGEQSAVSVTPSPSKSSKNRWGTPPVLERSSVMLSP